jgi:hypothetical protein
VKEDRANDAREGRTAMHHLHRDKSFARLVQGVAFAAAVFVVPAALAHDTSGFDSGYKRQDGDTYRVHHRHYAFSRYSQHLHTAGIHARHRGYWAASYRNEGLERDAAYEPRERHAHVIRASSEARERFEVHEARREEVLEAADERERPITAELNLVQLRDGRERAARIARRQLQSGAANG